MTSQEVPDGNWVDEILLGGRSPLRRTISDRQAALAARGLKPGGTVALWQPPSPDFVVNLLAVWRSGCRAILFDHRLTQHEVNRACERLQPQLLANQRGVIESRFGLPAMSEHVLVQLTSGSTGPAKIVGRTVESLCAELDRFAQMTAVPRQGERVVVLSSTAHSLGLVGGVLHGLRAGADVVLPSDLSALGILRAIAESTAPTTVLGVPMHLALLGSLPDVPRIPQLQRTLIGGEVIRSHVAEEYFAKFSGDLGRFYGMQETGVIAEDLSGWYRPALAPAAGMEVRSVHGELLVRLERSPYLCSVDPTRWSNGWLRTHDAGTVHNGLITINGRLDATVTVAGRKVDLMEVERVVGEVSGVREAVLVYDRGITAYVVLDGVGLGGVHNALAARLAPHERPVRVRILDSLPRTATGKLIRDVAALRTVESSAA